MAFVSGGVGIAVQGKSALVCSRRNPVRKNHVVRMEDGNIKRASNTTSIWDETVTSLSRAFPNEFETEFVDKVLLLCGGDEMKALEKLASMSRVNAEREKAIQQYKGRISAMEEGRLRRKATGSARDFFKSHIEVQGAYVDSGYVDESADTMKAWKSAFGNLFGGKKEEVVEKTPKEPTVGRDE